MAEAFDPYYIWLGIPPEEQPADHYRLLGVRRFETNAEVISNAADQRVRHLRSMQTGKRQAETQKLLNEISAATGTLLDLDKRKEYDAKLRVKEAAAQPVAKPVPVGTARPLQVAAPLVAPPPPVATTPPVAVSPSISARPMAGPSVQLVHRKKSSALPALIAIAGISAVLLVVAVTALSLAFLGNRKQSDTAGRVRPDQVKQSDKPQVAPPRATTNQEGANGTADPTKIGLPTPPHVTTKEVSQKSPPFQTDISGAPMNTGVNLATKEGKLFNIRSLRRADLLAADRKILIGEFSPKKGVKGIVTGGDGPDRAEFQFTPPATYMVEANLTRLRGEDTIIFGLMVGGHPTSLVLDGYSGIGPWSGLELVSGQRVTDANQVTAVKGRQITNGRRSSLRIFVLPRLVIAELDGRRIVEWSGDPATLTRDPGHATPNAQNISISTWGSSYHIESLQVTDIDAIEKSGGNGVPSVAMGPSQNQQVQLGKPVDILKESRPKMWAGAEMKDGQLHTSARQRQLSTMIFEYMPRGEYLLDATVTRTSGTDGIQFAITADGRPCTMALDCFVDEGRGAHSGLELINGQRLVQPNYPALYKGAVLTNGKPARVQILVRKGNIVLQVDGKILVDWKGDSAQLSRMHVTLADAGPRLAIGTWQSTYTVESLRIYPVLGSGGTGLATQNPVSSQPQEAFDVTTKDGRTLHVQPLQRTDLLGVSRANVLGDISPRGGMKGIVSAGNDPDRAEFQFPLPAEYMLESRFTRLTGDDAIVMGILVGGRPTVIAVDGYSNDGHFSGLDRIDGHRLNDPNHPSPHKGSLLTNGKKATLRVIVQPGRVVAELDGKRIADWAGDAATLDRDPSHATPDFRNFSLGTWSRSSYQIESLEISGIELTEASAPARPKVPVPDKGSLAKALEKLKETFGDLEQKGKKPEEKLKVSQEFVAVAASENDPAVRYALMDLARSLAMAGQDVATAISIAENIAQQYEVDESQLKLETLKLASGGTLPVSSWESAAELAAELASTAQEKRQLELADAASQLAVEHAAHGKNLDLKKSIKQLRDKVTAQLKLWDLAKAGEKTLESMPDDPAANLAVGKWYCLQIGDWKKGIPQLAKCGDAKLAAAAAAERDAKLLEAADAWSTIAEGLNGGEKLAVQRHALEIYQVASEKLTGLEQLKVAKRVTEMTELLVQSESQFPATGGLVPRSKVASDVLRPGLLVRIYASQPPKSPTPAVGIIHSYGDFAVRREQLAREVRYPASRLTFAGIGYIDLGKDESLLYRVRNGILLVDGKPVITNNPASPVTTGPPKKNKNPDQVRRILRQGRHSLQVIAFDATVDGPDFSVTRENGSSVISYSPADLETELGRAVLFHGVSTKGKFSLGNR